MTYTLPAGTRCSTWRDGAWHPLITDVERRFDQYANAGRADDGVFVFQVGAERIVVAAEKVKCS